MEKIASLEIEVPPKMKATKVVWGAMNEKLIVSYTDGTLRTFDPLDATELQYAQVAKGEDGVIELERRGAGFRSGRTRTASGFSRPVILERVKRSSHDPSHILNIILFLFFKTTLLIGRMRVKTAPKLGFHASK